MSMCVRIHIAEIRLFASGLRIGGKISNSDLSKFPTPTHKGNEVWLFKSMEIMVYSKKYLFQ